MNWELIYCLPVILLYNFVLRQLYIHCMICFLKIYNYVHIPISECVSIYGKIRCVSFLLLCPNIVGMFFCSASNYVDHQKKNTEFIAGALFAQRSETGILLSSILFRWWHFILSWYYYFRQIFSIIASSQSHTSLTISIIIHLFYVCVFGSLLLDSLT